MKTIVQNLQSSRIWQAVVTMFSVGCVTAALIVSLVLVQPETAVATGGCTAPIGVCTTVIDS